jgi:histone H1-like protein Hc1
METDNPVIAKWSELKALIEVLELDVVKNAKGVAAAGVRARKGLRDLKTKAAELVKTTVDLDKAKRAAKPAKV